jgi:hypothetical protein
MLGMRETRAVAASVAIIAPAVVGLGASPAFAATFTLGLAAPAAGTVGAPFVIQASGTDPTDQGALYLEVDAIPASVTTSCPSTYLAGSQLATSTGGSLVALDQRENFDAAGNFSLPVGYTPSSAGQWLFCGYTDDGATDTLATASAVVNVTAGSTSPSPAPAPTPTMPAPSANAARPANIALPKVTRHGGSLRCSRGGWSGGPTRFAFQWLVGGRPQKGAHGSALAITRKLHGRTVRCEVTASNSAGSASAFSAPLKVH